MKKHRTSNKKIILLSRLIYILHFYSSSSLVHGFVHVYQYQMYNSSIIREPGIDPKFRSSPFTSSRKQRGDKKSMCIFRHLTGLDGGNPRPRLYKNQSKVCVVSVSIIIRSCTVWECIANNSIVLLQIYPWAILTLRILVLAFSVLTTFCFLRNLLACLCCCCRKTNNTRARTHPNETDGVVQPGNVIVVRA